MGCLPCQETWPSSTCNVQGYLQVAAELISTGASGTMKPAEQAGGARTEAGPSLTEHTLQLLAPHPGAWEA